MHKKSRPSSPGFKNSNFLNDLSRPNKLDELSYQ